MTVIEFTNFLPEHFYALELRREDLADLAGADSEALIASWAGGRTLLADGRPVCVYGYAASGGVVCLWMLSGRQVKEMPLLMTKGGRSLISGFFRAGAHRVEAYCHADNVRSLAWLTRGLGFRVEGLMKKSGANAQDRWLLAIIAEDYGREEG